MTDRPQWRGCKIGLGRWIYATHKTQGGTWQIRIREDGKYDIREIVPGNQEPAMRGIQSGYVRAEFVMRAALTAAGVPLK